MSKLMDWLVSHNLIRPRDEVVPEHVRELLALTVKLRIERHTKWEIQNLLSVSEQQMEWLWRNALLEDCETDDERRLRLERERDPDHPPGGERGRPEASGDPVAERTPRHGSRYFGRWRTLLVHSDADLRVECGAGVHNHAGMAMALRQILYALERKRKHVKIAALARREQAGDAG